MVNLSNAEHGRGVIARWRMLAERRLAYLVELYESGRWTVYYKEPEFLKIVQEARAALKTWEQLAPHDPVQDKAIEVAIAQAANSAMPASPFSETPSPGSVEAKDDLRKA